MNPNLARTLSFRKAQVESPLYSDTLQRKETNDCTVAALQILTGCPYGVAHAKLKALGRRYRDGLPAYIVGPYVQLFRDMGFTLTQVKNYEAEGQFLVLTTNHAAAVVNGRAVNGLRSGSKITHIYRVERG